MKFLHRPLAMQVLSSSFQPAFHLHPFFHPVPSSPCAKFYSNPVPLVPLLFFFSQALHPVPASFGFFSALQQPVFVHPVPSRAAREATASAARAGASSWRCAPRSSSRTAERSGGAPRRRRAGWPRGLLGRREFVAGKVRAVPPSCPFLLLFFWGGRVVFPFGLLKKPKDGNKARLFT